MTVTNQFAAHVGLDWADKKHDVCVQFKNGERVFDVIEHTAEALDAWLTELHQKVKGRIAKIPLYHRFPRPRIVPGSLSASLLAQRR